MNKCWKAMERRDDHSSNYKSAVDKYNLRGDPDKEKQVSSLNSSDDLRFR